MDSHLEQRTPPGGSIPGEVRGLRITGAPEEVVCVPKGESNDDKAV